MIKMKFFKRLFKSNKKTNGSWTMFSSSESEVKEFLISMGELTIGSDYLKIEGYPFEPSIAFNYTTFKANQIDDIDYKSYRSTFRIENELIFLSGDRKVELEGFAKK